MAAEARVTLTEQDYIAANRAWLGRYLRQPRTIRANLVTLGLVAAILAALEWVGGGDGRAVLQIAGLGIVLGFAALILCYGVSYLFLPRRARRLFRQSVTLAMPYRYVWSDEGLSYQSDSDSGRRDWADFHRWVDDPQLVLLLLNEQLFFVIPNHALTAVEADDLRATIDAHGPPRF